VNDPVFASLWPNSCALITVDQEDPDKDVQRRLQVFCISYRLSKKESEVLALLIKGWDVPAVADALGLAYSTARTHVASILGKTQSSRQTELLAKVFGT
jgi:DNA-binding NarL/FixJ family response regulator